MSGWPGRATRSCVLQGVSGTTSRRSSQGPFLAGRAVAARQDHSGPVGGGAAGGRQAQSRLDAGDGAVGVEVPLLVRAGVAVPDDGPGAGGSAGALGVKAL